MNCFALATTAVQAAGILSFGPSRLNAQPLSNAPPFGAGAPLPQAYAKWLHDAPSQPEDLGKWLQDKDVVEVWFSGPWMEPLKLQDSIKTWSRGTNFYMPSGMTPGEGGGTRGSFVEICTTVTPEQIRSLLALQAVLDAHDYSLDKAHTHVWSYPGDADARRKARDLIPQVLNAAVTGITQALPSVAMSRPQPDSLTYRIPGANFTNLNGFVLIAEITPAKDWEMDALFGDDQKFHLPHLGLMVLARCRPSTIDAPEEYRASQRVAIRQAIEKAVEPLLKLEPSPIIYPEPQWVRPRTR